MPSQVRNPLQSCSVMLKQYYIFVEVLTAANKHKVSLPTKKVFDRQVHSFSWIFFLRDEGYFIKEIN